MRAISQLEESDRAALLKALGSMSNDHRRAQPFVFDELLSDWNESVQEVEAGYELSVYDYTNDITVRDLLEELLSKLEGVPNEAVWKAIEPWDKRFFAATREVTRPLLPQARPSQGSWWLRVPLRMGDELTEDLRSEGVL